MGGAVMELAQDPSVLQEVRGFTLERETVIQDCAPAKNPGRFLSPPFPAPHLRPEHVPLVFITLFIEPLLQDPVI